MTWLRNTVLALDPGTESLNTRRPPDLKEVGALAAMSIPQDPSYPFIHPESILPLDQSAEALAGYSSTNGRQTCVWHSALIHPPYSANPPLILYTVYLGKPALPWIFFSLTLSSSHLKALVFCHLTEYRKDADVEL